MTHQKRYTAEEIRARADAMHKKYPDSEATEMLYAYAHTESQLAGLVEWNMSLPELGDVLSAARAVQANGGDWYSKDQIEAILGDLVGEPALSSDAAYMSLMSPRACLALIQLNADLLADLGAIQAENDRLTAEATADAELIKRLNASLAEALAERDRLREALRECEVVLDGLTAHSYDSGSNFDFRVKNAHCIARKALEGEGK